VTKAVLPPINDPDCPHRGLTSLTTGPDGNVWIATDTSGAVVRMAPDFSFTEFPITGRPVISPIIIGGPDGNLWLVGDGIPGIWRVTPDGMMTSFPVESSVGGPAPYALDITVGPDGALWFITGDNRSIGRITVDGMTSYVTPYVYDVDLGLTVDALGMIVTGPDHRLWFTVDNGIGFYQP
jgi:virginiamycin B lyase